MQKNAIGMNRNSFEEYPFTSYQNDIWLEQRLYPGLPIYNIGGYCNIQGEMDIGIARRSIELLIHDSNLRVVIVEKEEGTCQRFLPEVPYEMPFYDFSDKDNPREFCMDWMQREFEKPFEYDGVLFQFALIKAGTAQYFWFVKLHHVLTDGWGVSLIARQMAKNYNMLVKGATEYDEPSYSYTDFIIENERYLDSSKYKMDLEFWKNKYPTLPEPLFDRRTGGSGILKEAAVSDRYASIINRTNYNEIKSFAAEHGCSIFHFMLGVLYVYFSKIYNKEEIVIGVPIQNRGNIKHKQVIGLFVSIIPLKLKAEKDISFVKLLSNIKNELKECYRHLKVPLGEIYRTVSQNAGSKGSFYDLSLSYMKHDYGVDFNGSKGNVVMLNHRNAKTALMVAVSEFHDDEDVRIDFDYQLGVIEKLLPMGEFTLHFEYLLGKVMEDSEKSIGDIEIIPAREKHRILGLQREGNKVSCDVPFVKFTKEEINQSIVKRFEDTVLGYKNNIAVKAGKNELTFDLLNKYSNRTANGIIAKCGGKNVETAALLLEHDACMIIGMLGALKAGRIYVPLDPSYPEERLGYMLEDSQSRLIVTNNNNLSLAKRLGNNSIKIINIDTLSAELPDENPGIHINPEQPAYILYTSGSTGRPKGVVQNHRNVLHFIRCYTNNLHINHEDKLTLISSYSFDAAVMDIYGALLNGAVLYPYNVKAPGAMEGLAKWIKSEGISIYHSTPTVYRYFMDTVAEGDDFPSVRLVVMGGEAVYKKDVECYKKHFADTCIFVNGLGPTESTVTLQYFINKDTEITNNSVPVGFPVEDTEVYLIDGGGKETPVYGIGELVYKSRYIAVGYWNLPENTRKAFMEDPAGNGRMYKSGDLGRLLPDGSIEFIGRSDNQVKIRGNRIELREIETVLENIEGIKEAVVTSFTDEKGESCLAAYYVPEKGANVNSDMLRDAVKKKLPSFMAPSCFVRMEEIPLTPSGKIDRNRLPEPDGNVNRSVEYEAPVSDVEWRLAEIWQDILGVEKVGRSDDFFDLGGHSLKATTLVSRIFKEFNAEIPLREIFRTPTIAAITGYIAGVKESIYQSVWPVEKREYYPVSTAQKRLYILNQLEESGTVYNMPGIMLVEGNVDIGRFEWVFKELVNRHEAFRTSFHMIGGEPVQKVHDEVEFNVMYMETDEEKAEEIANEFIRPFDLGHAPLLRVGLVKIGTERHLLLFDMHHIVSDGTSLGILVREFMGMYGGRELPPLRIQYKDYSVWQRELFAEEAVKKQEKYWMEVFKGEISVLDMLADYPRPAVRSFEGDRISFKASSELTGKLNKLAKDNGATLYMVLLAAYNILLSKYTGQEDIVVGSPIAGRPHTDLQDIIGMFANTLVMRNYPQGEKTVVKFLEEVRENALKAYENQDYPFEELVEKLDLMRDMSRNALFDTMLALQNTGASEPEIAGLKFIPYDRKFKISKFDLTFNARENNEGIVFELEYATRLFRKATVERLAAHYLNVMGEIAAHPEKRLSEIDILSQTEKQQILADFNNTKEEYPKDKTLHQLFEEQVERTPDNIAVVFKDKRMTYRNLNEKANRLARVLRDKGVKPDTVVGIMVERSLEMIVGILGVLKSGGVYLPIDPGCPGSRINYMLEDSKAEILLTQAHIGYRLDMGKVCINLNDESIYTGDGSNLKKINKPDDLAYIIYTSGTTGKPKGVMIEHKGVSNTIQWRAKEYGLNTGDSVLQLFSYSFDGFVTSFFTAVVSGAKAVLPDEAGSKDPRAIKTAIKENSITHMITVPQLYMALLECMEAEDTQSLRIVTLAGEKLTQGVVELSRKKNSNVEICNEYGPTENSVATTILRDVCEDRISSIGKPIANTKVHIVDKNSCLCPVGIPGELCVAGAGLARGYLNNPGLTGEKFVPNPFSLGEKMYRTGDLARWLPDGNIEFLGRIDHQVKIRGFRIELGEIEAQLLKYAAIKETVVIAREDIQGNKYLCAYIVGENEPEIPELREHLAKELPDYMIPSYFVQIDKMPLTTNGKLDRNALPEPGGSMITGAEYAAPLGEVEEKLAQLWQGILGVARVGRNDNFFDLGGHSLKAATLVSRIHKEFNADIPLREIFKAPTIAGIAGYIRDAGEGIYQCIHPVEKQEYYPMSSAQKRLYILNQLEGVGTAYNMPGILLVEGGLDRLRFEQAFKHLVNRHETLRASFHMIDGEPVQKVHDRVEFSVMYMEEDEEKAKEIVDGFCKPFDLRQAPLLRVGLVKVRNDRHIMLFDMHHIISDGMSMDILVREFIGTYEGGALPPLRIQYKDYSVWQRELLAGEAVEKQEKYWLETFKGEIPVLDMPADYPRPAVQSFEGHRISFKAGSGLTGKLNRLAKDNGATLYMTLLAAYNILLYKYTGQEDIIVGSPIVGRPHADLQDIIGMFVNTLGMRNYPKGKKTVAEFLTEVRENALKAYENQDYQFEELVEKLDLKRDMSRNALFGTMLVLQNTGASELEVAGLKFMPYSSEFKISKFDLTLNAREREDGIAFDLEYATLIFRKETVERLAEHYLNVLEEITAHPQKRLSEIDILSQAEKRQMLVDFNNTVAEYPKEKSIHRLFEEQAERTPGNIAVVFKDKQITYRELNEKANRLARVLKDKGVKPDSIVGILMERTPEMLIGILGILKAGGAYLPLEPEYPRERIRYMLLDSAACILLTQTDYVQLTAFDNETIDLCKDENYHWDGSNLANGSSPEDLAYIIYTSGSTGNPKGVMVEQKGLVNYIWWAQKVYLKGERCDFPLYSSISFDLTVTSIFTPLISGGSVVVYSGIDKAELLGKIIEDDKAGIIKLTPTHLELLRNMDCRKSRIKRLIVGGEDLKTELAKEIYHKFNGNIEIYNEYGPTETVVGCMIYRYNPETDIKASVPIGVPADNTGIYLFDKDLSPVPVNVAGEIYIAGDGVARGYINKPELTAERFVLNPFIPGGKMYRTGDLARRLPDGNIEFFSRIDHQVKIRGFRIELGEIESRLLKYTAVKEAVVIAREDTQGDKYLCAYVVGKNELIIPELKKHLTEELPEYMVPTYFVQLPEMPLTANGKIDRKALPQPDGNINTGVEYAAPSGEVEEKLVLICQDILGIERIGVNDSFFELGGHSLKATNLISRIHKEFDIKLSLDEVFKKPTISGIAGVIESTYEKSNEIEEILKMLENS